LLSPSDHCQPACHYTGLLFTVLPDNIVFYISQELLVVSFIVLNTCVSPLDHEFGSHWHLKYSVFCYGTVLNGSRVTTPTYYYVVQVQVHQCISNEAPFCLDAGPAGKDSNVHQGNSFVIFYRI
jgi:hypothetical protein